MCEGCGCSGEAKKEKATYVCKLCGKEEVREAAPGESVKSCCGQEMEKKEG